MEINSHTHTRLTAVVWDYLCELVPEGKTILDLNETRDSKWEWHQLGPSCRPTNSVKALKALHGNKYLRKIKMNLQTKVEICISTNSNADVVCYSATCQTELQLGS